VAELNELGTVVRCPCGDWMDVPLTVGKTVRREDGSMVLPISFDQDQFKQNMSDHLLADPTNPRHADLVVQVDD
jgi:hypothetical protein